MDSFKVGDIVECIEGAYSQTQVLVKGHTYRITDAHPSGDFVSVDESDLEWYANRFKKVSEFPTPKKDEAGAVRNTQIGGAHYHELPIQPYDYSLANGLGPLEHTALKYITRWKRKNGVEDLKKAIHTLQFLIEYTEKNGMPK